MSETSHDAKRCNPFAFCLGKVTMLLTGWKVEGGVPSGRRFIIIAAPHTSNWDFIYLLGAAYCFRLSINWLGKKNLFFPVFGQLLRFLGGIPVDRGKRTNMVDSLARAISEAPQVSVVIPPSGTRAKTDYWKSGFYHIAFAAKVPLICGYLDYEKKTAGLGLSFIPSGDISRDMERIRGFYADKVGRHPDKTSRIRLKEEDKR